MPPGFRGVLYSRIGGTRGLGTILVNIHRVTLNILIEQRLNNTHHRLVHIDVSARFRHLRQRLDRMRPVSGVDRNSAAAEPAGPEPTTSTSVSTLVVVGSSVCSWPSSNTGTSSALLAGLGRRPRLWSPVFTVPHEVSMAGGHR